MITLEKIMSEQMNGRSKKILIIGIVVAFVLAIIFAIVIYQLPVNKLNRALDLGNKYLAEELWEEAKIEFNKAIEIDPNNVEAYLGLAQAYVGLGDVENAIGVLENGYAITKNESISEQLSVMGSFEETVYVDVVQQTNQDDVMEDKNDIKFKKLEELMSMEDYDAAYLELTSVDGQPSGYVADFDFVDKYLSISSVYDGIGIQLFMGEQGGYYIYYGEFQQGMKSGHGVAIGPTESGYKVYVGEWKDNAPNGLGKTIAKEFVTDPYSHSGINVTSGEFINGLYNGEMSIEYTDEDGNLYYTTFVAREGIAENKSEEHTQDTGGVIDRGEDGYGANAYVYAYFSDGPSFVWPLETIPDHKLGAPGFGCDKWLCSR